jgi:hypothetical protein
MPGPSFCSLSVVQRPAHLLSRNDFNQQRLENPRIATPSQQLSDACNGKWGPGRFFWVSRDPPTMRRPRGGGCRAISRSQTEPQCDVVITQEAQRRRVRPADALQRARYAAQEAAKPRPALSSDEVAASRTAARAPKAEANQRPPLGKRRHTTRTSSDIPAIVTRKLRGWGSGSSTLRRARARTGHDAMA